MTRVALIKLFSMKEIIFVTTNKHKVEEISSVLKEFDIKIKQINGINYYGDSFASHCYVYVSNETPLSE